MQAVSFYTQKIKVELFYFSVFNFILKTKLKVACKIIFMKEKKEIELKAWNYNLEKTENALKGFASFCGTSFKSDRYFIQQNEPHEMLRLRIQKDFENNFDFSNFSNCEPKCSFLVTHKKRSVKLGIEENEETEFFVSDGESFEKILKKIGFSILRTKEKKTQNWFYKNFHIEMVEITGLGNFLEIETVLENATNEEIDKAKRDLKKILEMCEIDSKYIEEKPYSKLLKNNEKKEKDY